MSALPHDLPRLQAIHAWLARQRADSETIRTYLRVQIAAVQQAIENAQRYRLVPRPAPDSGDAVLHHDSCPVQGGIPVTAAEARQTLGRAHVRMCPQCRPQDALPR